MRGGTGGTLGTARRVASHADLLTGPSARRLCLCLSPIPPAACLVSSRLSTPVWLVVERIPKATCCTCQHTRPQIARTQSDHSPPFIPDTPNCDCLGWFLEGFGSHTRVDDSMTHTCTISAEQRWLRWVPREKQAYQCNVRSSLRFPTSLRRPAIHPT